MFKVTLFLSEATLRGIKNNVLLLVDFFIAGCFGYIIP